MTVRCNLIIGLRTGDQTETDVYVEGEGTYASNAMVQQHIMEAVREMDEDDWIVFVVIPADFSATTVPTPLAYQGKRPSNGTLAALGIDMRGQLGRCDARNEGDRCTEYLGHTDEEPAHVDEQGVVWFDEGYADFILGG